MTLAAPHAIQAPQPHRFSRSEYYQMAELGMFQNRRVELINGEVIDMPAMRDTHAVAMGLVNHALQRAFPDCWVRNPLPLTVAEDSEPEPDFAVVEGAPRDYKDKGHPRRALLVVEVSDSTLRFDRCEKASLYARAGIRDYWIINLLDGCVEVMRDPTADANVVGEWRYESTAVLHGGESLSPLSRPQSSISVSDLLP